MHTAGRLRSWRHLLDEVRADAGYAVRLLRRSPAFTAVAVLSLGLGIGANTAIFSLIDTVLLKQLPVQDPQTLFFIDNSGGKSGGSSRPPYPCFELLRDRNTTMAGMAAFDDARLKVTIDGVAEEMRGQYASGSYFDVLGVGALRGRVLNAEDDAAAVISYRLWRSRFNQDPGVIGRSILVGTRPVTIVGITPPEYFGLQVGTPVDVIVPFTLSENNLRARSLWWFSVVGRVKPGVAVEQARAELHTIWDGYMNDIGQPREKRNYFSGIALVPASRGLASLRRQLSEPLLIIMTIVGLVLLIGCANVANLLLARASARRNELSIRLAIGASRGRLIRQLLTEGAVLSVLGVVAGLVFARWGVSFLLAVLARADAGNLLITEFDGRVLAFAALTAVVSALLFSLAPAVQASRVDGPRPPSIGVTSPRSTSGRLGQSLVVIQVTLSIVLLAGAALFLRTLQNLHAVDVGFASDAVITMPVETLLPRRAGGRPAPAQTLAYHTTLGVAWRGMIDQVNAIPGVAAASVATMAPLAGNDRGVLIAVAARTLNQEDRSIHVNHVTERYFEALRIPLVAGRLFTARDGAGAPRVTILNRTAALKYLGEQNPIGHRVSFPGQDVEDEFEVVGVVGDVRYRDARTVDERMAYLPLEQTIDPVRSALLVARANGEPAAIAESIRQAAAKLMPGGFVPRVAIMRDRVDASLARERLLSMLAGFFGGLALLLACLGLYGVMAYGVAQRTREIGIRLAIGASKRSVMWMVLRETLVVVCVGIALGSFAAMAASRWISNMLFDVAPGDPLALGSAVLMLIAVAALAGYLPARRAARVDPAIALRYE